MLLSKFAIGAVLLFAGIGSVPSAYDQPYRPQYHFSPREHWMNDPNGLVYLDGEYHLFFQYNPFGNEWGHMTWGHAVTRDLVHWDQLPAAIPEENGIMTFTGSTVVDEHNTSGFCQHAKPCLVAVYTGHTPESHGRPALQTQNLAFSNDHGRHWTKYAGNPVLDLHLANFRDPKVFWSQQTSRWIMLVSLPDDHKVRIYASSDLKSWSALSDFGPAGAINGQWECPELFELPIDRSTDRRWVLKVGLNPGALQGGSGEQYFIGRFDGAHFTNDNPPSYTMWTDYGKDCYCGLTFNNLPTGQRNIMIGWMDNWQYAKDLPTNPWRGQMTFPRTLSLGRTPAGLRMIQMPIDQLGRLQQAQSPAQTTANIADLNRWLPTSMLSKQHAFQLTAEIPLGSAKEVGWRILKVEGQYTSVGYDRRTERLFVDRTRSGLTSFSKAFPARVEAPLTLDNPVLSLNLLVDRNSVEVFAEGGRVVSTNLVFPPTDASGIEAYARGGEPGAISATITSIDSMWAGQN